MLTRAFVLYLSLLVLSSTFASAEESQRERSVSNGLDERKRQMQSQLPRIPAKTPDESAKCFSIADGFQIELVASEPLVVDPIAFHFDASERLFVVEMIDYSERDVDAVGRIALLVDSNRDGKMDTRTTYVDNLSWPTAVHTWRDGVIVVAPPKITWFRDTDGDGRSDQSQELFVGFGRSNVQGMANSLRWTIDGYLAGATSSGGAELKSPADARFSLKLNARDFKLDPLTMSITAIAGGGQHGMAFNRWGDRFVTSNSNHLQQIIDLDRWSDSQFVGRLPIEVRKSIAVDGPQAEVYRTSPVEPWRIVRTRMRVSGEAPGVVEGGGRPAGYFTGATGTWLMDSDSDFGVDASDVAFVCDIGSNLVHRKKIESNGLFWKGTRIDPKSEFVSSSDIWFRPAQLGDGPDGALYIADMYREVVEHPKSLPPEIKEFLDLNSGNDRGRIWRVRSNREGALARDTTPAKKLSELTDRELVSELASEVSWRRMTAAQLLIEHWATSSIPELKALAQRDVMPVSKLAAGHLLHRFGAFDEETLASLMTSGNPDLCAKAVGFIELDPKLHPVLQRESVRANLREVANPRLDLRLAATAAYLPSPLRLSLLNELMTRAEDSTLRSVIVASAGEDSVELWKSYRVQPSYQESYFGDWSKIFVLHWADRMQQPMAKSSKATRNLRMRLADLWQAEFDRGDAMVKKWADAMASLPDSTSTKVLLDSLSDGLRQQLVHVVSQDLMSLRNDLPPTVEQLRRLRFASWNVIRDGLEKFTKPQASPKIQAALIEACILAEPLRSTSWLLERFNSFTPSLQQRIWTAAIAQPTVIESLLQELESGSILLSQLPSNAKTTLEHHPKLAIRDRFLALLKAEQRKVGPLAETIAQYQAVVDRSLATDSSSATKSVEIFQKHCAACHRIGELGQDVGPPLKSLHEKSIAQLVISILDPNREVDPKYQVWSILKSDETVLAGIIRDESATQLVIAEANGKVTTVLRDEIEQLKMTGVSLMPTGFHQQIKPEELAVLIRWLRENAEAHPNPSR